MQFGIDGRRSTTTSASVGGRSGYQFAGRGLGGDLASPSTTTSCREAHALRQRRHRLDVHRHEHSAGSAQGLLVGSVVVPSAGCSGHQDLDEFQYQLRAGLRWDFAPGYPAVLLRGTGWTWTALGSPDFDQLRLGFIFRYWVPGIKFSGRCFKFLSLLADRKMVAGCRGD